MADTGCCGGRAGLVDSGRQDPMGGISTKTTKNDNNIGNDNEDNHEKKDTQKHGSGQRWMPNDRNKFHLVRMPGHMHESAGPWAAVVKSPGKDVASKSKRELGVIGIQNGNQACNKHKFTN